MSIACLRRISLCILMGLLILTAVYIICKLNVKIYSFHFPYKLYHFVFRGLAKYFLNVCILCVERKHTLKILLYFY